MDFVVENKIKKVKFKQFLYIYKQAQFIKFNLLSK